MGDGIASDQVRRLIPSSSSDKSNSDGWRSPTAHLGGTKLAGRSLLTSSFGVPRPDSKIRNRKFKLRVSYVPWSNVNCRHRTDCRRLPDGGCDRARRRGDRRIEMGSWELR